MESRHQDPATFYKNLEKEWNQRIHTYTNSLTFTHALGKCLENHLDHVVVQQKIINNLLTELDIPKKDDYAEIAERKVVCEEKIDNLEDTIFNLNRLLKKGNTELKTLDHSLKEMLGLLENEVENVKATKLKTLKMELEGLKMLFND
ncbi:hypothetical protein J2Y03_001554 [Neobacillus niacini]|uniref:hypothetical protein n=1 Tax=Neobacillus niacini TaxID=86668 RepID=UPI00285B355A|nr:hypothetical protein [Neobacillus niacini]MDR7076551.1 hypothetical protein [Neobacillus niacini]